MERLRKEKRMWENILYQLHYIWVGYAKVQSGGFGAPNPA